MVTNIGLAAGIVGVLDHAALRGKVLVRWASVGTSVLANGSVHTGTPVVTPIVPCLPLLMDLTLVNANSGC